MPSQFNPNINAVETLQERYAREASEEVNNLYRRVANLESDCMTMALRLLGEDFDTFAPETREVMERLGKRAYERMNEVDV